MDKSAIDQLLAFDDDDDDDDEISEEDDTEVRQNTGRIEILTDAQTIRFHDLLSPTISYALRLDLRASASFTAHLSGKGNLPRPCYFTAPFVSSQNLSWISHLGYPFKSLTCNQICDVPMVAAADAVF